jgi:hypothetical protein
MSDWSTMNTVKDFLAILGYVFLSFICIFSFIAAFMFMVAGPTIVHTIIGTPVALTVLTSAIFGIKKIADSSIV